jgi:hypothetical protein
MLIDYSEGVSKKIEVVQGHKDSAIDQCGHFRLTLTGQLKFMVSLCCFHEAHVPVDVVCIYHPRKSQKTTELAVL